MTFVGAIAMLAAAAEPVAVPAPPPVILVPPPAPRIVETGSQPPVTLGVVVTAGRETLWSGDLRVGLGGADFSQSLRESVEDCPAKPSELGPLFQVSREFRVGINRRGAREAADNFAINVRWVRPLAPCDGSGSRTVSLDQVAAIAPGQTLRLTGDAGLVVTLTRRAK